MSSNILIICAARVVTILFNENKVALNPKERFLRDKKRYYKFEMVIL